MNVDGPELYRFWNDRKPLQGCLRMTFHPDYGGMPLETALLLACLGEYRAPKPARAGRRPGPGVAQPLGINQKESKQCQES